MFICVIADKDQIQLHSIGGKLLVSATDASFGLRSSDIVFSIDGRQNPKQKYFERRSGKVAVVCYIPDGDPHRMHTTVLKSQTSAKLGMELQINETTVSIHSISSTSEMTKSDLKVGNPIISINGQKPTSLLEADALIKAAKCVQIVTDPTVSAHNTDTSWRYKLCMLFCALQSSHITQRQTIRTAYVLHCQERDDNRMSTLAV